jgi:hypothetical protein
VSFTVTAEDAYNNTITGYTGTTHFTSSDGNSVLPGNHTLTSGTGTFSVTLKTAGSISIIATDTGSTATASSASVVVSPNVAAALSVGGGPNPTTAGEEMSFAVYAVDAYGNETTAYSGTVAVYSSDPGAILPPNFHLTTGYGTFEATLTTAGTQSITVTDVTHGAMTGSEVSITVNAGSATQIVFAGVPDAAYVGVQFGVTAVAEDAFGNVDTTYNSDVGYSSTDPWVVFKYDPDDLGSVSGGTFSGGYLTFYVTFSGEGTGRYGPVLSVTTDDGNGVVGTFSTYVTIQPG